jgi:hypothetical protein
LNHDQIPAIAIGERLPEKFPVMIKKSVASSWVESTNTDEEIAEIVFSAESQIYSFWEAANAWDVALVAFLLDSGRMKPLSQSMHFT